MTHIPEELIQKIKASKNFGAATMYLRQLVFGYIDMAWHTIKDPVDDANDFENKILDEIGLIPEIETRYRSTYFGHIFAGGYAKGYSS